MKMYIWVSSSMDMVGRHKKLVFCFQSEECMTLLKKLSSTEAECVIERLTSWARLQLEDKEHISDEVSFMLF